MIPEKLIAEVKSWIAEDPDPKTRSQLQEWLDQGKSDEIAGCFQGFLEFGTAGLRGALGPGPSRMNRAVVSKTAYGLGSFMKKRGLGSIVIGRDARYGSEDFTTDTAEIMSGFGFTVYVLPRPLPTPVLAYAVRKLKCDVGVMVTASHNPPQDNGYKVYLGGLVDEIEYFGSQIISPTDSNISWEIKNAPNLNQVARDKKWQIVSEEIINDYITTTAQLINTPTEINIVYTPLHGVGKETIVKVFASAGLKLHLVQEQAEPDPDFPTVAFPNPEEPGAIDKSLELAEKLSADLVIANDPDADRCAIAINDGNWRMLRGDEVGAILGEYLATKLNGKLVFANSIVSSSILGKIAAAHQIEFHETLTGFKYLSKVPGLRFGYEEALGYAVDPKSVNDKDGISAALVLAEIAATRKKAGSSIAEMLDEIWKKYGFHGTRQLSIRTNRIEEIASVMKKLRTNLPDRIGDFTVSKIDDLASPSDGLPPTDGIRIWLDGKYRVIVRPSGTEAKLKCYIEVIAADARAAQPIIDQIELEFRSLLKVA
ncbi:MAG: phospho-sugar mutase [Actinomycetales bacterium]|jgi:phosphomannomutase